MHRITVLGGGMVGGVMARDLARDAENIVTVVDRDPDVLGRLKAGSSVDTMQADLSDREAVLEAVKDCDVVVGAVPGWLGLKTLKTVIEAGHDIVDISFMPEDPRCLDSTAKENDVTAIVDCGVAPGLSNMLLGKMKAEMTQMVDARIYVGGLPAIRVWPYEYKVVFSPVDVLEEYTRPARYMREGKVVTMPALSEVEPLDIPGIGTLEAFNTDGLRTLLDTIPCPNMVEKTLRYPGHADRMRMLRETGFFNTEPITVDGKSVRPLDVTTSLLLPCWRLARGEEEFTVLRVSVEGFFGERRERHTYDLMDRTDKDGITSMARTTGFPASIAARLVAQGKYSRRGVLPPEFIGEEGDIFKSIINALADRGVKISHSVEIL